MATWRATVEVVLMRLDAAALNSALLPTAALIALGWALRHRWRFTDAFWPDLERLAYFVLLPALLVSGLARADFGGVPILRTAAVLAASALLGSLVTAALRRIIAPGDGPAFTSVFQGGVRFNNYIGLVVATALFGGEGLALAALCNAVLVPTVNVTSTLVLARYGGGAAGWGVVTRQVITNPLVLACVAGMTLRALASSGAGRALAAAPVPGAVLTGAGELIQILGGAALPIGLLCVGAGLRRPRESTTGARLIGWSMALRFVLIPAIAAGMVLAAGLSGPAAVVVVLFQSIPTASSAYVLARRLGGDAPLMAAIIAVQTVAGMATIPLWLLIAQAL